MRLISFYTFYLLLKVSKRLQKTFENTKFAGSVTIPTAAKPGGPEVVLLMLKCC